MRRTSFAPLAILTLGLGACGGDTLDVDPQRALVAGTYLAEGSFGVVEFTTHDSLTTETIDWLARGASILLDLRVDGTTAGRLLGPGAEEDGGDFDADLAGTWSLNGDIVRLQHEADTFLRDMDLVYSDGQLIGEKDFQPIVRVVLARR